ncbi:endosialidase [Vallitaleaceae bacterium 9-2]
MAGLEKLIVANEDNSISFGNHETQEKQKLEGFELNGEVYKVKTHNEITRLEKNGRLLFESVPGTTVSDLKLNSDSMSFSLIGSAEDAQITVELEADEEYSIYINEMQVGKVKSNLAGKINFSVDFASGAQKVQIKKY